MGERCTPREMLDRLVSFRTVPDRSNLDLVDWVRDYLAGHGIASETDFDRGGSKASLFASIGPDVPGGVVLSGHSDVVSVEGQNWSRDPWKATEAGGRIHGRGTCDMKGFVAAALAHVPDMLAAGMTRPIQIAISRDEEIGCIGAPPMIEKMRASLPPAEIVIVGEPTMMKTVTAHKGGGGVAVHVKGFEVHSSLLDRGVSAVMIAARLIDWANRRNAENAAVSPTREAQLFDPPWTSLHVGTIAGGTAQNITAKDCRFGLEVRHLPGETTAGWLERFAAHARSVEAEMKAVSDEAGIVIDPWLDIPALRPEANGPAERLARQLTGDNGVNAVSYGTEAGQFQDAGYSVVVCGPGDIAQAHQPDEFLEVSQLEAASRFVLGIVDRLKN